MYCVDWYKCNTYCFHQLSVTFRFDYKEWRYLYCLLKYSEYDCLVKKLSLLKYSSLNIDKLILPQVLQNKRLITMKWFSIFVYTYVCFFLYYYFQGKVYVLTDICPYLNYMVVAGQNIEIQLKKFTIIIITKNISKRIVKTKNNIGLEINNNGNPIFVHIWTIVM